MIRLVLAAALLAPTLLSARPPQRPTPPPIERNLQSELAKLISDVAVIEGQLQVMRGDPHAKRKIRARLADLRGDLGSLLASLSPPPPVVEEPAAPIAMDERAFVAVLRAINDSSFAKDKLQVLETAASDHWFTVSQVGRVVEAFSFAKDQLRAVELMAPRIVDPENRFKLYEHFTFSKDKAALRKILR